MMGFLPSLRIVWIVEQKSLLTRKEPAPDNSLFFRSRLHGFEPAGLAKLAASLSIKQTLGAGEYGSNSLAGMRQERCAAKVSLSLRLTRREAPFRTRADGYKALQLNAKLSDKNFTKQRQTFRRSSLLLWDWEKDS